jgi:hypothetical protein
LLFVAQACVLAYPLDMGSADLKKAGATLALTRRGTNVALTLALGADACKTLASLFVTAAEGATEIRVELPDFSDAQFPVAELWSLYAKATTGTDRAMVAHPAEKEWVASLLLSPARLKSCAVALMGLSAGVTGAEWDLESDGRFGYPSNLKLKFQRV